MERAQVAFKWSQTPDPHNHLVLSPMDGLYFTRLKECSVVLERCVIGSANET